MPATARRSKSEAYEKGIREGTAMAKRSRGNKPTEEEEMDMGMKPGHSRKRRKPAADGYGMKKPMDGGMYGKKPMDAECGCGKKKAASAMAAADLCVSAAIRSLRRST